MGIVNFSFEIHPVALAIAHIVNRFDFDYPNKYVDIRTYPFYNGRERCINISIEGYNNKPIKSFNIIFGEYRSSDSLILCVIKYEKYSINPITPNDLEEKDWNFKYYPYNAITEIANDIQKEIEVAIKYFE